jgi:hypothetical protein
VRSRNIYGRGAASFLSFFLVEVRGRGDRMDLVFLASVPAFGCNVL